MRRDYELGFIVNPEVSEEQTGALLERIEQIVTNHDGKVSARSSAARALNLPSRLPAVSSASTGMASWLRIGPVSRPASISMIETPV